MQRMTLPAPRDGRLDVLLAEAGALTRSQAARLIAGGAAQVDGLPVTKAGFAVRAGQALALTVPDAEESPLAGEALPLHILYQDDNLAVIDKPCGMVVHPAAGNESGTLVNALLFHLDHLSGVGGVKRPGIVHRLDKDTSGVMLVAKNDATHAALSAQLQAREMDKRYLAVVEGGMREPCGRIELPIGRSTRDRKRMAVEPTGRAAVTEWTALEPLRAATLLEAHILTGRTHQIRVHMRAVQHPVAGDPLYGYARGVVVPRLMLHAWSLAFTHPATGERLRFTADPPADYLAALRGLRAEPDAPWPWRREG